MRDFTLGRWLKTQPQPMSGRVIALESASFYRASWQFGMLAYADKNDASDCLYHRISWHQEVETRLKSYEAREPHGLTYIRRDEGSKFTGVGKALENASPPGGPRATIWPKRPQVQQAFPSCYYALFRFSHFPLKSRENHSCSNKLEY